MTKRRTTTTSRPGLAYANRMVEHAPAKRGSDQEGGERESKARPAPDATPEETDAP